jgi:spermidine/putrescine transport system substrate-binding protein
LNIPIFVFAPARILWIFVAVWVGGGSCLDAQSAPLAAGAPDSAEEKAVLRLLVEPDYLPDSVTDLFEKETGIHVQKETALFDVNVLGSLLAAHGYYDLVIIDDWAVSALVNEKKLEPISGGKIPNLKNIAPELLDQSFDPGNQYSVPYLGGVLGIVVNTDLVKSKIRDFPDVFRPEFKQKACLVDDAPVTVARIARRAAGNPSEGALTEKDLETIRPLVSKWLSRARLLDTENLVPLFQSGKVALGIVWSGQAAELLNADKKYRWVLPPSPTRVFIDSFVIPKHAEHKEAAEAFINFVLRPEIGKMIAEAEPYLSPNAAARTLLSKKALGNPASYPDMEQVRRIADPADNGVERLMLGRWFQSIQGEKRP